MERPTPAMAQAHAPTIKADAPTQTIAKNKTEKKINEKNTDDKNAVEEHEKKETAKPAVKKHARTETVVYGRNLGMSTKESVAVADYVRNKNVDQALADLEAVLIYKRAVPMRGEVPHRKGNMMAGRYPMKTVKNFIMLVKSLKSNALMHEMPLEKYKIFAMAHQASRPYKRFGQGKIKRSNVELRLIARDGGKKK
ncbi:MAG: hypothetical protein AABX16_02440 [Nanoarchaeota archaeon]